MKTEIGFSVIDALRNIFANFEKMEYDFKGDCKGWRGGSRIYQDREYGEQQIRFEFRKNKLEIRFKIGKTFCYCEDDCDCYDFKKIEEKFESWENYQEIHHETIYLTEKQVDDVAKPNLFS